MGSYCILKNTCYLGKSQKTRSIHRDLRRTSFIAKKCEIKVNLFLKKESYYFRKVYDYNQR